MEQIVIKFRSDGIHEHTTENKINKKIAEGWQVKLITPYKGVLWVLFERENQGEG